jgi:hypothetical protein
LIWGNQAKPSLSSQALESSLFVDKSAGLEFVDVAAKEELVDEHRDVEGIDPGFRLGPHLSHLGMYWVP